MNGFEPLVTEVYESFYLIKKCTRNVQLQHIWHEELVDVVYVTSVYTTIKFVIVT